MTAQEPPAKLRWRCRRGMQELDVMLGGWLEVCWAGAGDDLREAFDRLLEIEDDRLWDWLLGRSDPERGLEEIVEAIRARHFGPSRR
ncbi:succinate dehydrogenase assembly factor 2 [Wenzhouxiangella sediminis]|uniref:FAD assembly factor SdhE n=1 Tax=Wenzhouxiangella sediminis TaxID=1792836 RepID=A0A3E1KB14_9GAMM|nr:succinate dehydrogenase assembly factor 2 [Wenzhouxiangella sediminis]RFF31517.1 succinate dehydrogenase assembly factor 2 family protein [Wenzhouxiangella sediminis]